MHIKFILYFDSAEAEFLFYNSIEKVNYKSLLIFKIKCQEKNFLLS